MYGSRLEYARRILDDELDELFGQVPAIAIDGPKGVGKTTTAEQRVAAVVRLDSKAIRESIAAEPEQVLGRGRSLLIDEWQKVPEVWDVVRRAVDADPTGGQFLLVGSASAASGATAHSGAGRFGRLRMRPMTLSERGVMQPTVSLRGLLGGGRRPLARSCPLTLSDYVEARSTSISYRGVLSSLWLLDPVPAWAPTGSLLTRLGQTPKHHLADPALAARLLGLSRDALLDGVGTSVGPQAGSVLGHLFESLVTLCVRVPAQAAEATVGHLRTRNGDHEVDLVVVRDDGRALVVEVKLANTVTDQDTKHLHWLADRMGDKLLDAVVINTGPNAYRRPDGIAVVPLGLLAP